MIAEMLLNEARQIGAKLNPLRSDATPRAMKIATV